MTQQNETNADGVEVNLARHGKFSYVQIPAADPIAVGEFYRTVFGWSVSGRPEHNSFGDATGEVIGAFVPDLEPSAVPGVLPYIYVEGIRSVASLILANGGEVLREPYFEGQLTVATFRDPGGNTMGLWESGQH